MPEECGYYAGGARLLTRAALVYTVEFTGGFMMQFFSGHIVLPVTHKGITYSLLRSKVKII